MSDIPSEVVFKIICELPVKSLLKFRCVSKPWKALIDSPEFVNLHLKRHETKSRIVLCGCTYWCDLSFDMLDTRTRIVPQQLNYAIKERCFVLGSCNGLLLVRSESRSVLWNPSTRNYITLPVFFYKEPRMKKMTKFQLCNGLGYDKVTDDYKVLRIMQGVGDGRHFSQAVVYSLNSRSYKEVKGLPFWISEDRAGVFVFGALHWPVLLSPEMAGRYKIVAFDVGSDEYKYLHLPLHLRKGKLKGVRLGVLEGCLSLSCNHKFKFVDIWLLRDPGNRDSWAKLFSLKVNVNWSFRENLKPISYSKCGKYVILEKDDKELVCYDLKLKSVEKYSIIHGLKWPVNDHKPFMYAYLLSESLVLNNVCGNEVSGLTGKDVGKWSDPANIMNHFAGLGPRDELLREEFEIAWVPTMH